MAFAEAIRLQIDPNTKMGQKMLRKQQEELEMDLEKDTPELSEVPDMYPASNLKNSERKIRPMRTRAAAA